MDVLLYSQSDDLGHCTSRAFVRVGMFVYVSMCDGRELVYKCNHFRVEFIYAVDCQLKLDGIVNVQSYLFRQRKH
jgi:hypothetical protein